MDKGSRHLLVLTHGQEDGGSRATLAFALAVSLQAMGADVVVYLHSHASVWAFEKVSQNIHIPGFDSLGVYIDLFLEAKGTIYACASCVDDINNDPRYVGQYAVGPVRSKVVPAGITTLASLMMERKTVSI